MDRYKYFVFGTDAVALLMEENEKEFLETKDDIGYGCYEWDEQNSTPEDLLQAHDGWFDYCFVSKELFDKIRK